MGWEGKCYGFNYGDLTCIVKMGISTEISGSIQYIYISRVNEFISQLKSGQLKYAEISMWGYCL